MYVACLYYHDVHFLVWFGLLITPWHSSIVQRVGIVKSQYQTTSGEKSSGHKHG